MKIAEEYIKNSVEYGKFFASKDRTLEKLLIACLGLVVANPPFIDPSCGTGSFAAYKA